MGNRRACAPPASEVPVRCCRRKRPQTTHRHDVLAAVTVRRERHAFEGQTLAVIGDLRRRGVHYLLAILPDGSRSLIPAAWTDWDRKAMERLPPADGDDLVGGLADLLRLRGLIDALCTERLESASCRESRHAIEPGAFRPERFSATSVSGVGRPRGGRAHAPGPASDDGGER